MSRTIQLLTVKTVLVVRKFMCLCSPSSIIWYRSMGGDAPRLGK